MGQERDTATEQASSPILALDSLFGIKGPVRLVPQGGSQKPHIVLRRERLPNKAGEGSCLSGTTRFSLVANKRFTISKGHTLSLGIADPTHEDELKLIGSEGPFLLEFDICNELQMVENVSSLPARMRKSLTGTKTYDAFAEIQGKNSLGFPGYPLSIPESRVFASASVQTDPVEPVEIAITSSRTPPPTTLKNHKQKSPLRLYPSPISVDDDARVGAMAQSREDDSDLDAQTERSFSSMDLSTPSQSPTNSPVIRSASLPGNNRPLIPGPQDADYVPIPPAPPDVSTAALEGSGACDVLGCAQAAKPDELIRTEPNSCSIDPVHAVTSQLQPKETSQHIINSSSSPSPAATPPTIPILDSGVNTGNINVIPKMPRAMSQRPGLLRAPLQTQPHLPTPTPQPTISNPLGIRPSANLLSKPPPRGPRSLFGTATPTTVQPRAVEPTTSTLAPTGPVAPRKPVVVGAKWSALRGTSSLASSHNAATAGPSSSSSATATALTATSVTKATTPLLRYSVSPPHGEATSTIAPTRKRKLTADNVLSGQGSLKRVRSDGDNKGKTKEQNRSQSRTRGVVEEQLRKKVKIENVEVEFLPSTSARLPQETSNTAVSRVDSTTVDGGDSVVDGVVPKGKAKRRRQRENRKRSEARMKRQEEFESAKEKENIQRLAAAAQLVLPAPSSLVMNILPSEAPSPAPPRIVHPLPPKPVIPITGSSYRPGRKRERRGRSSASSRSGGSPSRSRSRSLGRETTQARRIRSPSRRSRERDSPVNPQHAKPSAAANAHEGAAQSKEEKHTANEARVLRTSAVPAQHPAVAVVVNSEPTWPTTSPSKEFQLLDLDGARVPVQQLVFSSDGKRLAITTNDLTVEIWETTPQAREVLRWQSHTPIVALCWLQYDAGVLVLCSDGSTNTWTPGEQTEMWELETLFNVHFSSESEKPLSLAYGKDKIAISTTASVKVWVLTSKGVWQPQRGIKRSGVTALRFQTDGIGLFGGCRDGTVWYCEVPNGTLRAYAFLPSNKCITSIHLHPHGTQLLIGQKGGTTYLVSHQSVEKKGKVEKKYCTKIGDETEGSFTPIFATGGQAVVSGTLNGCALVWDRKKGNLVYGLKHRIDDAVLAIAAFDGRGMDGMMVTGTREGKLCWWPIPQAVIR